MRHMRFVATLPRLSRRSSLLALVIVVAVSACGALSDADEKVFTSDRRQPEAVEWLFLALASDIWSEKPCYLIHPQSMQVGGFNSVGAQASYLRSICFRDVAEATRNPRLCDKVRSVSTFFLSGAAMNRQACIDASAGHSTISRQLDLPAIIEIAGFDLAAVDALLVAKGRFTNLERAAHFRDSAPGIYWSEVRQYVIASPEFFERITRMPGFASEADRVAMREVTWQPRYRRDLPLPEQRATSPRTPEIRLPFE